MLYSCSILGTESVNQTKSFPPLKIILLLIILAGKKCLDPSSFRKWVVERCILRAHTKAWFNSMGRLSSCTGVCQPQIRLQFIGLCFIMLLTSLWPHSSLILSVCKFATLLSSSTWCNKVSGGWCNKVTGVGNQEPPVSKWSVCVKSLFWGKCILVSELLGGINCIYRFCYYRFNGNNLKLNLWLKFRGYLTLFILLVKGWLRMPGLVSCFSFHHLFLSYKFREASLKKPCGTMDVYDLKWSKNSF